MEQADWKAVRTVWEQLVGAGVPVSAAVYSVTDGGRGAGNLEEFVKRRLEQARAAYPGPVAEWETRWNDEISRAAPGRRRDWAAGRMAILRVLEDLGHGGPFPHYSLTHTAGVALAVAAQGPLGGRRLGVGVDLEVAGRAVSPQLSRRLLTDPEESALVAQAAAQASTPEEALAPLDLWVMKEAAFKAQPRSKGTSVLQYRLQTWKWDRPGSWGYATLTGPRPGVSFRIALGRLQNWVVGLAVAESNDSVGSLNAS
ncbi:MAG TPA: 4'-phosphopantetheinyl transferase superfamily protein [Bdellovibrionota bacterium]|jgi:4'-phosphopantetheinyl transferase EntD|nr:4'-phosphopantetheinyl transferase superfamily protein [Bdellovibrionota bacterium]